jgi:DNA-directed RNA polymerase subunit omega
MFMTTKITPVDNRYMMVLIASARVRELKRGHMPLVSGKNKEYVTAIREIEEGKIGMEYISKVQSSK